jgi:hypothetical protein
MFRARAAWVVHALCPVGLVACASLFPIVTHNDYVLSNHSASARNWITCDSLIASCPQRHQHRLSRQAYHR